MKTDMPLHKPRIDLATVRPLLFRRGEGRGEGSVFARRFKGTKRAKRSRCSLSVARVTYGLTLFCLWCLACPVASADSRIRFGGVPVELTISQVSEHTLQIELT